MRCRFKKLTMIYYHMVRKMSVFGSASRSFEELKDNPDFQIIEKYDPQSLDFDGKGDGSFSLYKLKDAKNTYIIGVNNDHPYLLPTIICQLDRRFEKSNIHELVTKPVKYGIIGFLKKRPVVTKFDLNSAYEDIGFHRRQK